MKKDYEENNYVYDLSWAAPVYKEDPMLIMDTIGSSQLAFNVLEKKITDQLKLMNTLHLFNQEKVTFEEPKAKTENSNDYKSKSKSKFKRRMTA